MVPEGRAAQTRHFFNVRFGSGRLPFEGNTLPPPSKEIHGITLAHFSRPCFTATGGIISPTPAPTSTPDHPTKVQEKAGRRKLLTISKLPFTRPLTINKREVNGHKDCGKYSSACSSYCVSTADKNISDPRQLELNPTTIQPRKHFSVRSSSTADSLGVFRDCF